jgi:hypothetical protein
MFPKLKQQLADTVSVPAKNASFLSILAVTIAVISLLLAIVAVKH